MKTTSRRLNLFGGVSLMALGAGLLSPAAADTTGTITIDNDNAPNPILTSANTESVAAPTIVDLQELLGANAGTATADDNNFFDLDIVGNNTVDAEIDNLTFARTVGNESDNFNGLSSLAGSIILVGQQTVPTANGGFVGTSLAATTNDTLFISLLAGPGLNVSGDVVNNQADARVAFNDVFSIMQTTIPAGLTGGAQGSYTSLLTVNGANSDAFFPTSMEQIANYNVASVQVNVGFSNGNAAAGLTTASVDDTTILLGRAVLVDGGLISGNFNVDLNKATSLAFGNLADNAIFLESGESSSFAGTAFVSSTQSSNDAAPAADGLGAISASTEDTNIAGVFAALLPGGAQIASAIGLNASVDGNVVTSSATINSSRNELAFDGTLELAGGDSATQVTLGAGTAPPGAGDTIVNADYGVVNNQTAAGFTGPPEAEAFTESALVALSVEDVNGTSNLSLSANVIGSSATGQASTNIIRNNNNAGSPSDPVVEGTAAVTGSFASVNRQYIFGENITAAVLESGIVAAIGALDNGTTPFGGLVGSTLIIGDADLTDNVATGNVYQALATGNRAGAVVDITGGTIDATGDQLGANIFSERFESVTPHAVQISDGGVNLANWQFVDGFGGIPVQAISGLLDDVDIQAFVNYDGGVVGDTDSPEVANATIRLDGNQFQAGATINSYGGAANLTSGNSLIASVAALSYQSTGMVGAAGVHELDSTITGSEIAAFIGLNDAASTITAGIASTGVAAITKGNDSVQTINATAATSITGDSDNIGVGAANVLFSDAATATSEVRLTEVEARAAFLALSDQATRAVDAEALVQGFEVNLVIASGTGGGAATLTTGTFEVANNGVRAQVVGNDAANTVNLAATNSIIGNAADEVGATAGVVSSQSSVLETALGDTAYLAEALDNLIIASILEDGDPVSATSVTVLVGGNAIGAVALANRVNNALNASAQSFTADVALAAPQAQADPGANDLILTVTNAPLFIANRQRNEGDVTGAEPGPTVGANAHGNEIFLNLDGGDVGLTTGVLTLGAAIDANGQLLLDSEGRPISLGNLIQASVAGNVATNALGVDLTNSGAAGAVVLNRQGNSGNLDADNQDSVIEANLFGDATADHVNVALKVDGNAIASSAIGSSASNSVSISAGNTLNGGPLAAGTSGAFIGTSAELALVGAKIGSIVTDTGTADSNGDAVANGHLVVANTQRNHGGPLDGGINLINAETENAEITLNVPGSTVDMTTSQLSLSFNRISASAGANFAANTAESVTGNGATGLFSTVLNDQGVSATQVTSAVTDASAVLNVAGNFSGGGLSVNANQVVASASLNEASNKVSGVSTVGDLPSATIVNHQTVSGSSASSSVTGTTIASAGGLITGSISNSTVSVSGNQVGAATTLNKSTNNISAPGQTFTRTSSF